MRIADLFKIKKAVFSFEIFPPKINTPIESIYPTLERLSDLKPDYISVTYSAGGSGGNNRTAFLANLIREKYNTLPLAHLTCVNNDANQIKAILDNLKDCGIENILALRGDLPTDGCCNEFAHASDLAAFIKKYGGFGISGACYPEGHPESNSIIEDVQNLKLKVDSGVSHLNSQLFFDNEDFMRMKERMALAGISVPVQAGIMPIVKKRQIERTVTLAGSKIPNKLARMFARFADKPDALMDAGISYATEQIIDLLTSGVDGIHLYVMNNGDVAQKIYDNIKGVLKEIND